MHSAEMDGYRLMSGSKNLAGVPGIIDRHAVGTYGLQGTSERSQVVSGGSKQRDSLDRSLT